MPASFCPRCGTPLVSALLDGRERERCPSCAFVLFLNPVPVGLAVVDHGGRLVLVRRNTAPLAGYWAPPAGYVETGESVPEAVVREAREESGLEIALDGLLGVYSQRDVNVVLVAYRAHSTGGAPVAGDDAEAVALFAPGGLPEEPPPVGGTPTDLWFHRVILEVTRPWRRPDHDAARAGGGRGR